MFPLQSALLPGETLPLRIFEPRYCRLVRDTVGAGRPAFGVVMIARGREVGGGDVRSDVGTIARVTHCLEAVDDPGTPGDPDQPRTQYQLLAAITDRFRVLQWLADDPYPRAVLEAWPDEPGPPVTPERIGAVVDGITALYQTVAEAQGGRLRPDALAVDAETADDPARHVYALAAKVPLGQADRYAVLAAPTLAGRVDTLLDAIETVTAMVQFQLSGE